MSCLLAYCHTQLLYIPGTPNENLRSILLVSAPQPKLITACEKSLGYAINVLNSHAVIEIRLMPLNAGIVLKQGFMCCKY